MACSLDEAVQAARAIQQHHLAVEVHRLLRRNRNSVADLAAVLHERRETLAAKLTGRRPAGPGDIVVWLWLAGRTSVPLPPLVDVLGASASTAAKSPLPAFPLPRRRDQTHGRPAPGR